MKRSGSYSQAQETAGTISPVSQTLVRGLDVLEVVATGPLALPALAHRLGLARSTAHRLATALLERRYLTLVPRQGYGLGPKLLELGSCARDQTALVRVARPCMEGLAEESLDTVHLSIREAGVVLLLERIPGRRRMLPSLRIGERMQLTRCAPGLALLLDSPEDVWRETFAQDCGTAASSAAFVDSMKVAAKAGYAFDPGDTDDRIATIAAPVRGAAGNIVAALGLSTAAQYLHEDRLETAISAVVRSAEAISFDLGRPGHSSEEPNAAVHRLERRAMLDRASPHNNGGFVPEEHAKPLEAGAEPVHDPAVHNSRRADKQDTGA
jgi:DNA-binding IclR family transcriptional regulator